MKKKIILLTCTILLSSINMNGLRRSGNSGKTQAKEKLKQQFDDFHKNFKAEFSKFTKDKKYELKTLINNFKRKTLKNTIYLLIAEIDLFRYLIFDVIENKDNADKNLEKYLNSVRVSKILVPTLEITKWYKSVKITLDERLKNSGIKDFFSKTTETINQLFKKKKSWEEKIAKETRKKWKQSRKKLNNLIFVTLINKPLRDLITEILIPLIQNIEKDANKYLKAKKELEKLEKEVDIREYENKNDKDKNIMKQDLTSKINEVKKTTKFPGLFTDKPKEYKDDKLKARRLIEIDKLEEKIAKLKGIDEYINFLENKKKHIAGRKGYFSKTIKKYTKYKIKTKGKKQKEVQNKIDKVKNLKETRSSLNLNDKKKTLGEYSTNIYKKILKLISKKIKGWFTKGQEKIKGLFKKIEISSTEGDPDKMIVIIPTENNKLENEIKELKNIINTQKTNINGVLSRFKKDYPLYLFHEKIKSTGFFQKAETLIKKLKQIIEPRKQKGIFKTIDKILTGKAKKQVEIKDSAARIKGALPIQLENLNKYLGILINTMKELEKKQKELEKAQQ